MTCVTPVKHGKTNIKSSKIYPERGIRDRNPDGGVNGKAMTLILGKTRMSGKHI